MPKFKYVAIDPSGAKVTRRRRGRQRGPCAQRAGRPRAENRRGQGAQEPRSRRDHHQEAQARRSHELLAAVRGVPPRRDPDPRRARRRSSTRPSNAQLKAVLIDISDALRSGSTLSDAMASHENVFPSYYIGILRSAELTGNLDIVLDQLSGYIERDLAAKRAVKSALTYPIVIMVHGPVHGGGARRLRAPEVRGLLQELRRQAPAPHPDAPQLLPLREQLVVRHRR